MAIAEFIEQPLRKRVAYFGASAPGEAIAEFSKYGLTLVAISESQLLDRKEIASIDSVIFLQEEQKPSAILGQLGKFSDLLLNSDCNIYVKVVKSEKLRETARKIVVNAIGTLKLFPAKITVPEWEELDPEHRNSDSQALRPWVCVCDADIEWERVAQYIVNNPGGAPPSETLEIVANDVAGSSVKLDAGPDTLIRRAFSDCAVVHLVRIVDGLSGAPAFQAYPELANGQLGRWPYKSFVKIGPRSKITSEYLKYKAHAMMYVPFHLGPRLDLARCHLGAKDGILVADFVQGAEALRDCAREGRAAEVLANLFNVTLRAWHDVSSQSEKSLISFLAHLFPTKAPEHRTPLLGLAGVSSTLDGLRIKFLERNSAPVRIGPIHGDLHATNVMVRGTDAIVIDFEKAATEMPLLFDFASLEAGLLVDGFVKDNWRGNEPTQFIESMLSSIQGLYEGGVLLERSAPCHPKERSAWFHDCVYQIRLQARQWECFSGQYATALALCLIKKGCNPEHFQDNRDWTRAVGFALGERILMWKPEEAVDASK
jgi:hypothetical protein